MASEVTSTDVSLQKCWKEKQKDGAVAGGGNGVKRNRSLVRLFICLLRWRKYQPVSYRSSTTEKAKIVDQRSKL